MFEKLMKSNGKGTVNKDINTKELPYRNLSDFIGMDVQIFGYFFSNTKYGKQLVVVTPDCLINMPKNRRIMENFESFNEEEIDAIKEGKIAMTNIRNYQGAGFTTTVCDFELLPF